MGLSGQRISGAMKLANPSDFHINDCLAFPLWKVESVVVGVTTRHSLAYMSISTLRTAAFLRDNRHAKLLLWTNCDDD